LNFKADEFLRTLKIVEKNQNLTGSLVILPAPLSFASTPCCYARHCCWPLSLASMLAAALLSRLRCSCRCRPPLLCLYTSSAAAPHGHCRPRSPAGRRQALANKLAAGQAPTPRRCRHQAELCRHRSKLEPPPPSSSLTPQGTGHWSRCAAAASLLVAEARLKLPAAGLNSIHCQPCPPELFRAAASWSFCAGPEVRCKPPPSFALPLGAGTAAAYFTFSSQ
jgi:hypothetical protein